MVIYSHYKHLVSKSFLPVTDALGQKCDEESVGQTGGQMILHIKLLYFSLVAKDS